jgi:hypothetical protein
MGRPKGSDSRMRRCHIGLTKLSGHVVSRKKAVLTHQVVGILAALEQALGDTPDQRCLAAAIQLGFQGLCRKSEYSATYDRPFAVNTSLTMSDVQFRPSRDQPEVAVILLKKTKTDMFQKQQLELILPMDQVAPINACRALKHMFDNSPVPAEEWATTALFSVTGAAPAGGGGAHDLSYLHGGYATTPHGLRVALSPSGVGNGTGICRVPGGGTEGCVEMVTIRVISRICEVCR